MSDPMTPERLEEIRKSHDDYVTWISTCVPGGLGREIMPMMTDLIRELDRLTAENARLTALADGMAGALLRLKSAGAKEIIWNGAGCTVAYGNAELVASDALTDWKAYKARHSS